MDDLQRALGGRAERMRAHAELRESPEFRAQVIYLNRLTWDFIKALTTCWLAATRNTFLLENSLVLRRADDILESAVAIQNHTREGMHNPARREKRYALEALTKYLFVDQAKSREVFADRLGYFEKEVQRASIGLVDQVVLSMLSEEMAHELRAEVKSEYTRLSCFVHASAPQLRGRIADADRGIYLGFETVRQFEKMNRQISRFFDLCLAFLFHGVGAPETGDAFIQVFDHDREWKFHRTKYVSQISASFDYKLERQTRPRPGG